MNSDTDPAIAQELTMMRYALSERNRLIGRYQVLLEMIEPFIPPESPSLRNAVDKTKALTVELYGEVEQTD